MVRETLKIKKAFLNFQNKKIKIEDIQKIISSKGKPKPCLNMTTKRPSCKQVMVLMNATNTYSFIKDSNTYIANINRALKNIKLDVIAGFICMEK